MRLHVGIDVAGLIEDLVCEPREAVVHALGRLAGSGEELDAGAIGGVLLGTHIGQQRALDHGLRRLQGRHAGLAHIGGAAAGGSDQRARSEQQRHDRLRRRLGDFIAQARQVAACDVTRFMGEHADHLVRRVRLHQRASIDEDAAAVGDECVEGPIVDDYDLNILLAEPGGLQKRLGVVAQKLLDLGIADDRRALRGRLRWCGSTRGEQGNRRDQRGEALARTTGPWKGRD
jgi:hypothetical protein